MFKKEKLTSKKCNSWTDLADVVNANAEKSLRVLKKQKRANFWFIVCLLVLAHDIAIISKRAKEADSLAKEGCEMYWNHAGRIELLEKEMDALKEKEGYVTLIEPEQTDEK